MLIDWQARAGPYVVSRRQVARVDLDGCALGWLQLAYVEVNCLHGRAVNLVLDYLLYCVPAPRRLRARE